MPLGGNRITSTSTTITTRMKNAPTGISRQFMAEVYTRETCFRSSTTHHDGTEKATKRYGLTTTGSHPTSAQARRTTTTAHGHRSIPSILLSEALHAQIWRHPTAITPFTAPAIWMPSPLKALSSLTSKCSDGTAVTLTTPPPHTGMATMKLKP